MKRKKPIVSIDRIHDILEKEFAKHKMPVVDLIQFQTKNPFKVLVSTILSARTKDETTVRASQRLFEHVTIPADLHDLSLTQIEKIIFPVGFYKNKAKYLKALPEELHTGFQGRIPDTVEELVRLPGVGRKTANLVVAVAFGKPAVCVDIHVHRISNRLGYVSTGTPFETEMALRKKMPKKYWITFNSYFVSFGQHLCTPLNPRCNECPIYACCKRIGVKTKFERT
ncbi:MAG: endonuclease III [Chitinivibrionales bacterium]|nr:endonuclease III [Chitinivibrionales bacterium]